MTKISDRQSVIEDPISDEDLVVNLLASLPESYYALVTALEANEAVPRMEVLTACLLHGKKTVTEFS